MGATGRVWAHVKHMKGEAPEFRDEYFYEFVFCRRYKKNLAFVGRIVSLRGYADCAWPSENRKDFCK